MSRSPELSFAKKFVLGAGVISIGAVGIANIPKDSQDVTAKNDTTCWKCPGGDDLTELQKVSNCATGQVIRGEVAEGTTGVVEAPSDGTIANKYGFTRVAAENIFSMNPITQEKVDLGPDTCWIKSSDLKKVK